MHHQLRKCIFYPCAFTRERTVLNTVTEHFIRNLTVSCRRYFIGYVSKNSQWGDTLIFRRLSSKLANVNTNESESDLLSESVRSKIWFNSVLEARNLRLSWLTKKVIAEKAQRKQAKKPQNQDEKCHDFPLSLKYLTNSANLASQVVDDVKSETPVQLPYSDLAHIRPVSAASVELERSPDNEKSESATRREIGGSPGKVETEKIINWMKDYELYDERKSRPWQLNYGTANPAIPISKVPCGGCGALLHCQDTAIPGFLPRELFQYRSDAELRTLKCQRCHFLSHYNIALNVSVAPEEYPRLLEHIKDKRALVLLMVDLTDFPCSVWPGLIDIIGRRRPVVIVGNKVDLLPPDGPAFLEHVTSCLRKEVEQTGLSAANIKHVALVSAANGFGVEQLITKLHNIWEYEGDVYLMGCTNVGKSTLFNALLQSDYCKVKAVDLLQRATTSPWPGTTLNLLKFPILRPSGWRQYQRMMRLRQESKRDAMEQKLRSLQMRKSRDPTLATLIGHIGRTFRNESEALTGQDPFSMGVSTRSRALALGLDPNDKEFREGHWCYDTPGTVQPDQVLNLLTTQELMLTLPRQLLLPRTFLVRPGRSLLLAGLARLDYLQGRGYVRLTVLSSDKLPVTLCDTSDAETVYKETVGTEILAVPCGDPDRLARWPGLTPHHEELQVEGISNEESAADIVLSSAGWVAVTPGRNSVCHFRAWTPHGRGVYLRQPALLRFAVNLRGSRLRGSPAYRQGKAVFVKSYPIPS